MNSAEKTAREVMSSAPWASGQLRPNMTIPNDDIFLAGQSLKANRPTYVEFVGADADLGAESVLKAIARMRKLAIYAELKSAGCTAALCLKAIISSNR